MALNVIARARMTGSSSWGCCSVKLLRNPIITQDSQDGGEEVGGGCSTLSLTFLPRKGSSGQANARD